jgi:hypothetical protein
MATSLAPFAGFWALLMPRKTYPKLPDPILWASV